MQDNLEFKEKALQGFTGTLLHRAVQTLKQAATVPRGWYSGDTSALVKYL